MSGIIARPGVQKAISDTAPVIFLFTHLLFKTNFEGSVAALDWGPQIFERGICTVTSTPDIGLLIPAKKLGGREKNSLTKP